MSSSWDYMIKAMSLSVSGLVRLRATLSVKEEISRSRQSEGGHLYAPRHLHFFKRM